MAFHEVWIGGFLLGHSFCGLAVHAKFPNQRFVSFFVGWKRLPYHRSRFWILKIYADRIPQGFFREAEVFKFPEQENGWKWINTSELNLALEESNREKSFAIFLWVFQVILLMVQKSGVLPVEVGSLSHDFYCRSQEVLAGPPSTAIRSQRSGGFFFIAPRPAWRSSWASARFCSPQSSLGRWSLVGHCIGGNHEWFCWETGEKKHPHMLKCDENCFFFVVVLWILCRGITGSQQKVSFFLSTWSTGIFSNARFLITRIHQTPIGRFMKIAGHRFNWILQ